MNGYEKRKENKRTAIILAAQELIAKQGIAGTSITDIASRASVSRVTLFKYFGDKDTLVREVLCSWIDRLIDEYDRILSSDLPFQEKMLAALSVKTKAWDSIGDRYKGTSVWDDPEIQALISEIITERSKPKIIEFIELGKQAGSIEPSLDNEAILVYFSSFRPIIGNTEYMKKGKAFQTSLFNLFMGGLMKNWYQISKDIM